MKRGRSLVTGPRPVCDRMLNGVCFWSSLIHNWPLVRGLVWRQISAKYRDSVFGMFWTVLTPLIMLAVYTFVFTIIFANRWGVFLENKTNFALYLFVGLCCHQFLAECMTRSPGLIAENKTYVKKIIFPLEVLSWICVITAGFTFLVNFTIALLLYLMWFGFPPLTVLLMPLVLGPLLMFGLGISWLFSALGVYLRDLRQVSTVLVTLFLFATPIFYPMEAVPAPFAKWLTLNPLAGIVNLAREVTFLGELKSAELLGFLWVGTAAFATLSSMFFMRVRRSFADVV